MEEVKEQIIYEMKTRGVYDYLQRKMAAVIESTMCIAEEQKQPSQPREILVLLELALDYLNFMGFKSTASVLEAEVGIAASGDKRDFLIQQVGLKKEAVDGDLSILHHILLFCQQFGGVVPVDIE